jgi:hypothetical protein
MKKLLFHFGVLLLLVTLTGCGGSKVLKEPEPFAIEQPLSIIEDQHLAVVLEWVIVRDGPGTWVKNAIWDEYLMSIQNRSDQLITITQIVVVDSLDTRIEPHSARNELVKLSKASSRRYKEAGITVKAGAGRKTLRTAGLVAGGAAVGAAAAGSGWGAAGATVGGGLVLVPVLAVGGIMRGVNNSKVSEEIELRHTQFPLEIPANGDVRLDVFFPLAPSPQSLELKYENATGEYGLVIETGGSLDGLHIVSPAE